MGGKKYSTWAYFKPLLFKDEEGTIPAGCPEDNNDFAKEGTTAYLKGRRIDPETKITTIIGVAKFENREDLTLAFKNSTLFMSISGWLCDPMGSEEDFEGSLCFSQEFNDRDALAQISLSGN